YSNPQSQAVTRLQRNQQLPRIKHGGNAERTACRKKSAFLPRFIRGSFALQRILMGEKFLSELSQATDEHRCTQMKTRQLKYICVYLCPSVAVIGLNSGIAGIFLASLY